MTFNDNSSKVSNSISYSEKKEIDAKLKTLNEAVASLQDVTAEHTETLDNITSGNGETVIPLGSGGTGQTDTVSDRNALLNDIPEEVDAVTDDTLIAGVYPDTDITSGKLSKRKVSLMWNYFKQKVALENIGTGSDIARSASDPTTIAETFNNVDEVLEEVQQEIEDGVTSDSPSTFTYNGTTYTVGAAKSTTTTTGTYTPIISYYTSRENLYWCYLSSGGWGIEFTPTAETTSHTVWAGLSPVLTKIITQLWIDYISRGAANGLATLDSNGKLLASQLPANSRQIVGEIDTSTVHTLPDVSGYNAGNELIVTGAGYYIQDTAFTLAAGKTLTDMEVAQANKLIAAGYVFTLYEGTTALGTVSAFATTKVTLTDSTEVALPYSVTLSATSTPSTVQVETKVGDEIIALDGHWILLASDTDVSELTEKIETIEKVIPDDATESNQLTTESTVNSALEDYDTSEEVDAKIAGLARVPDYANAQVTAITDINEHSMTIAADGYINYSLAAYFSTTYAYLKINNITLHKCTSSNINFVNTVTGQLPVSAGDIVTYKSMATDSNYTNQIVFIPLKTA